MEEEKYDKKEKYEIINLLLKHVDGANIKSALGQISDIIDECENLILECNKVNYKKDSILKESAD